MWTAPVAGLSQSVYPAAAAGSQSPQLLAHGVTSPQGHSPTPAAGTGCLTGVYTQIHTHTHTHTQTLWIPPVTEFRQPVHPVSGPGSS